MNECLLYVRDIIHEVGLEDFSRIIIQQGNDQDVDIYMMMAALYQFGPYEGHSKHA